MSGHCPKKLWNIFYVLALFIFDIWGFQSGENLNYGFLSPNIAHSGEWTSPNRLQNVNPETPISKILIYVLPIIQMMAKLTSLT
jgi:hypothetical protein